MIRLIKIVILIILIMVLFCGKSLFAQDTLRFKSYHQTVYLQDTAVGREDSFNIELFTIEGEHYLTLSSGGTTSRYMLERPIGVDVILGDTIVYFVFTQRTPPFSEGVAAFIKDNSNYTKRR